MLGLGNLTDSCSYFGAVLNRDKRVELLEDAISTLQNKPFDTIVVTGTSGLTFGSMLADRLCKDLIVVRKPNESRHSPALVELADPGKRWIFVDDFIDTGATFKRVQNAMRLYAGMEYVGTYRYMDDIWSPPGTITHTRLYRLEILG